MTYKIYTALKEITSDYETRFIQIIEGLDFSQYKVIKMAEYYSNSRYLGGNKDELQRDKPFYNIVNYRVTLAKTATDLDIKDVQITSDDPKHTVHSMLLQKEAYEWMKDTNFAYFLNKMGQARPKYGGVLVKRTMKKDEDGNDALTIEVVDWRNTSTDQVDILGGAIVETHYMSPPDLMKKENVWKNVREAITLSKKNTAKSSKYDQKIEQHNTDKIVVREVIGVLSEDYYLNANDEKSVPDDTFKYNLQHYFIADVAGKGIPLFSEIMNEDDFPYDYLPWEEMPGRAIGRGIIEDAEEAQVWTNDSVINEKNAMDLAGKVIIKTNSSEVGNNILEIDNGRIFELGEGKDMNSVNLAPTALGEFNSQIERWQDQADKSTSSFDANVGSQPPSDTPYSQTALLNQVAAKPFDYRREEAGIFISRMFEKWIIPYLTKKIKAQHILASDFTDEELDVIDGAFANFQASQKAQTEILEGKIFTKEDYDNAVTLFKSQMKGKRRFLDIPDGFFDGVIPKITVITTGEQKNKSAILQSLSTILGNVMQSYNPQTGRFAILDNPVMARIFGTILELSGAGISPASLGIGRDIPDASPTGQPQAPQAPQAQPQAPQGAVPSPMQQPALQQPA